MIKDKVAKGLITQNPGSPHFFTMPKIHKEGIPRRPVISLVNNHTSKVLEYIDYHLQAIVREIPPFIKDTNDLPCKLKLNTEISENSYLVELDYYRSSRKFLAPYT